MWVFSTVIQTEKFAWAFLEGILSYYCFFPTTYHTYNGLGLNPGFRSERPASNRLKHGTALSRMTRPR